MKKPTWVTVVGVLGIIFSCLGILGAGQEMLMPKMFKMQQEMLSNFETIVEREMERAQQNYQDDEYQSSPEMPMGMFESFSNMLNFPEWYGTWSIISGILKLLVCAFFLLASIRLLQLKPSSINLFYAAALAGIALGLVKAAVAMHAGSFMATAMIFGSVFGIILDIILIIVVATGNKAAFYQQGPPPLPQRM